MLLNKFIYLMMLLGSVFSGYIHSFAQVIDIESNILYAEKEDNIIYILNKKGAVYKYNVDNFKIDKILKIKTSDLQYCKVWKNNIYFFKLDRIFKFNIKDMKMDMTKLTYDAVSQPLCTEKYIFIMTGGEQLNRISIDNFSINLKSIPLYSIKPKLLNNIYLFDNHIIVLQDLQILIYNQKLELIKKHLLLDVDSSITNYIRHIRSKKKNEFLVSKNNILYKINSINWKIKKIKNKKVFISTYFSNDSEFIIKEGYLYINNIKSLKLIGGDYKMKNIGDYVYVYNDKYSVLYLGDQIKKKFNRKVNITPIVGDYSLLLFNKDLVKIV